MLYQIIFKGEKEERKTMKTMNNIALTLLIIGGLNWGLVGIFNYNLVDALFGNATWISRLVYALVGLSAVMSFGLYARTAERER